MHHHVHHETLIRLHVTALAGRVLTVQDVRVSAKDNGQQA